MTALISAVRFLQGGSYVTTCMGDACSEILAVYDLSDELLLLAV